MVVMNGVKLTRVMTWACASLLALAAVAQEGGFPPAAVVVDKVRRTEIAPTISIPGTVLSRFDSRLASEVEGRVIWFADVGTVVTVGEPLVQLESTTLEIQRKLDRGEPLEPEAQ